MLCSSSKVVPETLSSSYHPFSPLWFDLLHSEIIISSPTSSKINESQAAFISVALLAHNMTIKIISYSLTSRQKLLDGRVFNAM